MVSSSNVSFIVQGRKTFPMPAKYRGTQASYARVHLFDIMAYWFMIPCSLKAQIFIKKKCKTRLGANPSQRKKYGGPEYSRRMPVCGLSTRLVLAFQNLHLIHIKIALWEVGEAAKLEDLQRWIKEALGNASVAATKKVQFCPITPIYSK